MSQTPTSDDLKLDTHPKKSVLIVDDTPGSLAILVEYLRGSGFETLVAESGEAALEQTDQKQPDIILLDVLMPGGIDGFETCRRLKADPTTKNIPVIFTTGLANPVDKLKGLKLGAVDYIIKPLQCEEVVARISTHLVIHNLQENLREQNLHLQQEEARHRRLVAVLEESRERYRLLAESSGDIIAIQTPDGIYRYVSPASQAVLGYEDEELVGRSVYEFIHPEDVQVLRGGEDVVKQRPALSTTTYRARHKAGYYVWLETTSQVIYHPRNNRELEIVSFSRDVTGRKQSEAALRQSNEALEKRVSERTAKLSMAVAFLEGEIAERKQAEARLKAEINERKRVEIELKQEIAQRERAENELRAYSQGLKTENDSLAQMDKIKDEFLANTAHELRTPLNGIIGIVESMIDGATGRLSPPQLHNLTMVTSSGQRLIKLIDDNLDSSKLKHEKLELSRRAVDVHSVADVVLTLIEPVTENRSVRLINDIDPELPAANADETRLQQILSNLVDNALKFTDRGTVRLEAKVHGEMMTVMVSDTGVGIAADKLTTIFQPRLRSEQAAQKQEGSGLGLSITKQLVELHGGTIRVESVVGQGTDFIFTLPLHKWPVSASAVNRAIDALATGDTFPSGNGIIYPEESQPALDVPAQALAENKNFTILVVDDELINVQILTNHLSLQNYVVSQAFDGFEALEAVEESKPDLILLDVMMPKLSGYEVCEKIRETYPTHELPIILLTTKSQSTDLLAGIEAGANDYITKPIEKNELLVRVKTHLRLAKINIAYGRFVPHEFLRFLDKESIEDVNLGDQVQREMSILFSDIRSFTSLSENMSPQENFQFLNEYLGRVSPVIRQHRGFIDKYIGDSVMALFPEKVEDALEAAIAMQLEVSRYNQYRQTQNHPPIRVGIGLHTGTLMLGTIGETQRMEGTVIADAVNLASRLEGLTKLYGVSIVISEHSLFNLESPTQYHFRFLDRVKVKGKQEPVSVFEIFDGDPIEIIELKRKTLSDFENGLLHYHNREFGMARTYFGRVLQQNPDDKATALYLKRAEHFMEYGVPPDWEGIEALTEK